MERLIDANAAKIQFAKYREDCINGDDINAANVFADVVAELDEFPTIDPVHTANGCYCWECKYYREFRTNRNKQLMRLCYRMGKHDMEYCVKPDDFCSYGKRREEDCGDRVDEN